MTPNENLVYKTLPTLKNVQHQPALTSKATINSKATIYIIVLSIIYIYIYIMMTVFNRIYTAFISFFFTFPPFSMKKKKTLFYTEKNSKAFPSSLQIYNWSDKRYHKNALASNVFQHGLLLLFCSSAFFPPQGTYITAFSYSVF